MQQDIFGSVNEPQQQKQGLIISAGGKQALSKKQKEFNRLVKKLEKSRTDLERLTNSLNEGLTYYAAHLHHLEQQLITLRTACVKLFFPFYKDKKLLSKGDKDVLAEVISFGLEEILSLSSQEPDDEIKAIFKTINGTSFEELKKNSFEEMKFEMEGMFEDMGFDVNLDDLNENMSEEEVMRKMKEMHENFIRQAEEKDEKNATRKKTKKQEQREEREKQIEEAKHKNIGTIYKQLAKAFHPDLEKDETLKVQKEELMKQLTVAYENNDLHTLLKLEIAWIQKEENNPDQLSEDKLGIYNEVLKEQVMELEMELDVVVSHPRYMPLQRFVDDILHLNVKVLEKRKSHLKETVLSLENCEIDLKSKDALRHVKDTIHSRKNQVSYSADELDDLLEEFMKLKK